MAQSQLAPPGNLVVWPLQHIKDPRGANGLGVVVVTDPGNKKIRPNQFMIFAQELFKIHKLITQKGYISFKENTINIQEIRTYAVCITKIKLYWFNTPFTKTT